MGCNDKWKVLFKYLIKILIGSQQVSGFDESGSKIWSNERKSWDYRIKTTNPWVYQELVPKRKALLSSGYYERIIKLTIIIFVYLHNLDPGWRGKELYCFGIKVELKF